MEEEKEIILPNGIRYILSMGLLSFGQVLDFIESNYAGTMICVLEEGQHQEQVIW